ncbi:helix-turn-helix transcriptional regulator [Nonomuraea sp. NPDC046802]|uniref:helix-turn-helix domain-containing protein n=1 Tax=Nonomuraea sp. NPDC046802 TaxID=3154919 RepID=UPI003402B5FE
MSRPDDGAKRIGENVRAARRARGTSLETLAGLVGRSKGWLSKVENGKIPLEKRSDIVALADALEVSATELVDGPTGSVPRSNTVPSTSRLREILLNSSLRIPRTCPSGLSVSWKPSGTTASSRPGGGRTAPSSGG